MRSSWPQEDLGSSMVVLRILWFVLELQQPQLTYRVLSMEMVNSFKSTQLRYLVETNCA